MQTLLNAEVKKVLDELRIKLAAAIAKALHSAVEAEMRNQRQAVHLQGSSTPQSIREF